MKIIICVTSLVSNVDLLFRNATPTLTHKDAILANTSMINYLGQDSRLNFHKERQYISVYRPTQINFMEIYKI